MAFNLVYAAAQTPSAENPLARLSGTIRDLTRRASPSVVEIMVTGYSNPDDQSGSVSNQISIERSSGSGVIVDPSGFIMTNAHVVEGAISIKVLTASEAADGKPPDDAKIVGIDADSDLALIRIDRKDLPTIAFGNSETVHQGDLVFAIGSPIGLRNSVSMGVVSAPARTLNEDNPIPYIQTDASINPGNSGGALVDTTGALVGMNAFILSQSGGNEGIGFAIPSNVLHSVYQQLRDSGHVARGTVGLYVQNITTPMAAGLDLPKNQGIVVADVNPRGPGDQAGVKRRDVVLSLDGTPLKTARQFQNLIYRHKAGDALQFVIQRSTSRLEVTLRVEERPDSGDPLTSLTSPENNLIERLGILCVEIDKKIAEALPDLRRQYGLIVAAKAPGHPELTGLQQNDVIHAINNQTVTDLALFRKLIDELKAGSPVALQIERNHRLQYVAFDIR